MGYCPFSSLGHDTACCVATRRVVARAKARHGLACVQERVAARARDMAPSARDMVFVSRHDFCVATRGHRHSAATWRPTTQRDSARHTGDLGAVRARLGLRCAHYAHDPVLR